MDTASRRPSGENCSRKPALVMVSEKTSRRVGKCHNLIASLCPSEASVRPSGENATSVTSSIWPDRLASVSPLATFHNRMVPSMLPVASVWPSGENDNPLTKSIWPVRWRSEPSAQLNRYTKWSRSSENARYVPPDDRKELQMGGMGPLNVCSNCPVSAFQTRIIPFASMAKKKRPSGDVAQHAGLFSSGAPASLTSFLNVLPSGNQNCSFKFDASNKADDFPSDEKPMTTRPVMEPVSVIRSMSHKAAFPTCGSNVASRFPSGENCRLSSRSWAMTRRPRGLTSSDHNMTLWSLPPVARNFPSGLNAAHHTSLSCPCRTDFNVSDVRSQSRTV